MRVATHTITKMKKSLDIAIVYFKCLPHNIYWVCSWGSCGKRESPQDGSYWTFPWKRALRTRLIMIRQNVFAIFSLRAISFEPNFIYQKNQFITTSSVDRCMINGKLMKMVVKCFGWIWHTNQPAEWIKINKLKNVVRLRIHQ